MPLPSPAQIVHGSATVIFTAFLMLLLFPEPSLLTATLIATGSLLTGLVVAVPVQRLRRRTGTPPLAQSPATVPVPRGPTPGSTPPGLPPLGTSHLTDQVTDQVGTARGGAPVPGRSTPTAPPAHTSKRPGVGV